MPLALVFVMLFVVLLPVLGCLVHCGARFGRGSFRAWGEGGDREREQQ